MEERRQKELMEDLIDSILELANEAEYLEDAVDDLTDMIEDFAEAIKEKESE